MIWMSESGDVFEITETSEDKAIQQEKLTSVGRSNSPVIEKDMKKNQDSELELNHEYGEEKVDLSLQIPSLESLNSSTVGTNVLDVKNVESNASMPDGTEAVDFTESFITEDSTSIKRKSSDRDNTSLQTQRQSKEGQVIATILVCRHQVIRSWIESIVKLRKRHAFEKPIRLENNNVLAFIKTLISALVRCRKE
ncbi:uncharacterized protein [Primulina huaijiensis]|uniref:uncharacterized protein isoform X1 n=1 Tax=Primulina huaijiensis TaxID=1492673 RepID=UPI003CC701D1